jgi:hypothetical protein
MKERYNQEVPKWLRLLGAWRINQDSIDFKWGYFAPRFGFKFIFNRGTYFDQRYAVSFALGWGVFMVYLPFETKLEEGCDMPRYGFDIHDDVLWLYKGGDYADGQCQNQWIALHLPFFNYEFDGHWIKDKDLNWIKMNHKNYGDAPDIFTFRRDLAHVEVHPYTYTLSSGEVQERTATCMVEKRRWHRKWFPWLTKESTTIDIEFNDEVGERSGSWKGGTIGCGYEMLPEETIESCLRRMEKERKF